MIIFWETLKQLVAGSTNPGVENVAFGVEYVINGVTYVGTLQVQPITMKEATLIGQSTRATLEAQS